MAQVTLTATKDCGMQSNDADVNKDSSGYVQVGEWASGTEIDRGLFQFDLSSIPAGSTIDSATLRLYDRGTDLSSTTRIMRVYRCVRNWGETTVTWNKYDGTNLWTE